MDASSVTVVEQPPKEKGFRSQLLERLSQYSAISFAVKNAHHCYNATKEHNKLFKFGLETAESGISRVTSTVTYYGEPLLLKADDFGCRRLDTVETKVVYPLSEKLVKPMVECYDPSASKLRNLGVIPAVLADLVLDASEGVIEYFLPLPEHAESLPETTESKTELVTESLPKKVNKVTGERLKQRLCTQYTDLSFRSREKIRSMPYVVDLIEYARVHIDNVSQAASHPRDTAKRMIAHTKAKVGEVATTIKILVQRLARSVIAQAWNTTRSITARATKVGKDAKAFVGNRWETVKRKAGASMTQIARSIRQHRVVAKVEATLTQVRQSVDWVLARFRQIVSDFADNFRNLRTGMRALYSNRNRTRKHTTENEEVSDVKEMQQEDKL